MDAPDTKSLPANAYQPLAPGEAYQPVVPAAAHLPEATWRSVGWGLLLCVDLHRGLGLLRPQGRAR